jgi:hypothetical protein
LFEKFGIEVQWASGDTAFEYNQVWDNVEERMKSKYKNFKILSNFDTWKEETHIEGSKFRFINDATHLVKLLRNLTFGPGIKIRGNFNIIIFYFYFFFIFIFIFI